MEHTYRRVSTHISPSYAPSSISRQLHEQQHQHAGQYDLRPVGQHQFSVPNPPLASTVWPTLHVQSISQPSAVPMSRGSSSHGTYMSSRVSSTTTPSGLKRNLDDDYYNLARHAGLQSWVQDANTAARLNLLETNVVEYDPGDYVNRLHAVDIPGVRTAKRRRANDVIEQSLLATSPLSYRAGPQPLTPLSAPGMQLDPSLWSHSSTVPSLSSYAGTLASSYTDHSSPLATHESSAGQQMLTLAEACWPDKYAETFLATLLETCPGSQDLLQYGTEKSGASTAGPKSVKGQDVFDFDPNFDYVPIGNEDWEQSLLQWSQNDALICSAQIYTEDQSKASDTRTKMLDPHSILPGTCPNMSRISSSESMAEERRKRHLLNAKKQVIQPKAVARSIEVAGASFEDPIEVPSSPELERSPDPASAITGDRFSSKPAPTKTPHKQVKKRFCTQCKEKPEGFRGDHELKRHIERCHAPTKEQWIVVDPALDKSTNSGVDPSKLELYKPVIPIAGCPTCDGRRVYQQDYNAAAHIRRRHYVPVARGRKKKSAALDGAGQENACRKGSVGGDYPPLAWFREVGHIKRVLTNERDEIIDSPTSEMPVELPEASFDATSSRTSTSTGGIHETLAPMGKALLPRAPSVPRRAKVHVAIAPAP